MEQNMDGEWEKHDIDWELLVQLDHLFNANEQLPMAEEIKARNRRVISNLTGSVRPRTLECTMHNLRCLIQIYKLIRTYSGVVSYSKDSVSFKIMRKDYFAPILSLLAPFFDERK